MSSETKSERGKILLLFENHKFYKKEALKSGEIKWCCTMAATKFWPSLS
jgi:hypothetical protein